MTMKNAYPDRSTPQTTELVDQSELVDHDITSSRGLLGLSLRDLRGAEISTKPSLGFAVQELGKRTKRQVRLAQSGKIHNLKHP